MYLKGFKTLITFFCNAHVVAQDCNGKIMIMPEKPLVFENIGTQNYQQDFFGSVTFLLLWSTADKSTRYGSCGFFEQVGHQQEQTMQIHEP